MDMRFCPVRLYSCPRVSKRLTAGSLPTQRTIPATPRKNNTATAALVRFDKEELPASAKMAISEARAEIIPMRDREKTSAANMATAMFAALVFSRSRMGIISALASLMAIFALAGSSSLSKRTRAAVAVLFFLGVAGMVLWVGSDPAVRRFETLGHEYTPTGQNRISIWRDTLTLIHQHPLFGTGLGTFSVAYTSVQSTFLTLLVDHAHCDYLEVVSELGLPGGILVFGSIFWIFARTVRRYRKTEDRFEAAVCLGCMGSIAAILVHSMADFNLYIPANALVFTVTLALACKERESSEVTTGDIAAPAKQSII